MVLRRYTAVAVPLKPKLERQMKTMYKCHIRGIVPNPAVEVANRIMVNPIHLGRYVQALLARYDREHPHSAPHVVAHFGEKNLPIRGRN